MLTYNLLLCTLNYLQGWAHYLPSRNCENKLGHADMTKKLIVTEF